MIEVAAIDGTHAAVGVAGDTFNTAVYLARQLGPDRVSYVSILGDDSQSDRIVATLARERIDCALVGRMPHATPGLYMVETDATGERRFSYWRGHSAARHLFLPGTSPDLKALDGFALVYISAITIAIMAQQARDRLHDRLRSFRERGGLVAFDSNHRSALWSDLATARSEVARFWTETDLGFPSLDDEIALFGDADETAVLARLAAWGLRHGALKRGASGPRGLCGAEPGSWFRPAPRVVDTTAAGDSFNAGFIAR